MLTVVGQSFCRHHFPTRGERSHRGFAVSAHDHAIISSSRFSCLCLCHQSHMVCRTNLSSNSHHPKSLCGACLFRRSSATLCVSHLPSHHVFANSDQKQRPNHHLLGVFPFLVALSFSTSAFNWELILMSNCPLHFP